MHHIYIIQNLINNKIYVGQTSKPKVHYRWNEHIRDLKKNNHHNCHLQNAWNTYSEHSFVFYTITIAFTKEDADTLERFYKKWYSDLDLCYNIRDGGEGMTESDRKRISESHKKAGIKPPPRIGCIPWNKGLPSPNIGKKMSEEFCRKTSEGKKKAYSEGQTNPNKGKPMSQEQKEKISESTTGRVSHNKGKTMSEEQKAKISDSNKGKIRSVETREKMAKSKLGNNNAAGKRTEEQKLNIRIGIEKAREIKNNSS